jgi:hypothetical protein
MNVVNFQFNLGTCDNLFQVTLSSQLDRPYARCTLPGPRRKREDEKGCWFRPQREEKHGKGVRDWSFVPSLDLGI